jgi:Fe-S-cluster-containing hydrogenase component 2
MEAGRVAINQALCTQCEACMRACPSGALSHVLDAVPAKTEDKMPVPVKKQPPLVQKQRTLAPWVGTTLAFLTQEILPRLVDVAVTALERRREQPAASLVDAEWRPVSGKENRPRHRRRRQRGSFS